MHTWIPNQRSKTVFSIHSWLNPWMWKLGIWRIDLYIYCSNPCCSRDNCNCLPAATALFDKYVFCDHRWKSFKNFSFTISMMLNFLDREAGGILQDKGALTVSTAKGFKPMGSHLFWLLVPSLLSLPPPCPATCKPSLKHGQISEVLCCLIGGILQLFSRYLSPSRFVLL